MSEASIVLKAYDQMSGAFQDILEESSALSKEYEAQQRKLQQLGDRYKAFNRQAAETAGQAEEIKKAMAEARKEFRKTGDEADRAKFTKLRQEYKALTDQARDYDKAAAETRKAMRETAAESRRSAQSSGAGPGMGMMAGMAKAGGLAMVGNLAGQWAGTMAGSLWGSQGGALTGSVLSGAGSGAAIGSMVAPGVGTAVGAVLGGALGGLQGAGQAYEQKDQVFKGWVQEQVEGQLAAQQQSLTTGSGLAAGREKDLLSFTTLFHSQETAVGYLSKLVDMANATPFLYGDLTAMSKTLATYKYDAGEIIPALKAIGDAGADLGHTTADMQMVATAIGRMRSSGKASLEYINMLQDRGIGAVDMLAQAKGVDQGTMYDMISKAQITGQEAAEIILDGMTSAFSGAMERQSMTFSGLESTVQGLTQELDVAMGEAYNEARKQGLLDQQAWLSGDSAAAVKEANAAIGAWKAELENSKEKFIRDAVDAAMDSDDYRAAKAQGDAAEMGKLIQAAKVRGLGEYNASEGAQLALESELALAGTIRDSSASSSAFWEAGWAKSKEYSKGLAAGLRDSNAELSSGGFFKLPRPPRRVMPRGWGHAAGLMRVPFDGYPAILHQGERVLTAAQVRDAETAARRLPEDQRQGTGAESLRRALAGGAVQLDKWPADSIPDAPDRGGQTLTAAQVRDSGPQQTTGRGQSIQNIQSIQNVQSIQNIQPLRGTGPAEPVRSHAAGLMRVPFDGYAAILHQGERVLTAGQVRDAETAARRLPETRRRETGTESLRRALTAGPVRLDKAPAAPDQRDRVLTAAQARDRGAWDMTPALLLSAEAGGPAFHQMVQTGETGARPPEISLTMAAQPPAGGGSFHQFLQGPGIGPAEPIRSHGAGLDLVPYDNYPAILHQGERVLTAAQARSRDAGDTQVQITGNTFVVRQESDIDAIAAQLAAAIRERRMVDGR